MTDSNQFEADEEGLCMECGLEHDECQCYCWECGEILADGEHTCSGK